MEMMDSLAISNLSNNIMRISAAVNPPKTSSLYKKKTEYIKAAQFKGPQSISEIIDVFRFGPPTKYELEQIDGSWCLRIKFEIYNSSETQKCALIEGDFLIKDGAKFDILDSKDFYEKYESVVDGGYDYGSSVVGKKPLETNPYSGRAVYNKGE